MTKEFQDALFYYIDKCVGSEHNTWQYSHCAYLMKQMIVNRDIPYEVTEYCARLSNLVSSMGNCYPSNLKEAIRLELGAIINV